MAGQVGAKRVGGGQLQRADNHASTVLHGPGDLMRRNKLREVWHHALSPPPLIFYRRLALSVP